MLLSAGGVQVGLITDLLLRPTVRKPTIMFALLQRVRLKPEVERDTDSALLLDRFNTCGPLSEINPHRLFFWSSTLMTSNSPPPVPSSSVIDIRRQKV